MSNIDRRDFLKILGVGAIVGIWGGSFFEIVNKRELEASIGSYKKAPEALQAKKWAMVIDIKKLNKKIINDCIEICHSIHNVPTIANPKEEIKWIWEEKFKNVFPEIKDQYLSYELMEMPL